MLWQKLDCPQCGGPLPKQARWRMVTCPFCRSTVGLGQQVVKAASFREAWQRALAGAAGAARRLDLGRQTFRLLAQVGLGSRHEVHLASRLLPTPAVASVKLALDGADDLELRHEAEVLKDLQCSEAQGAPYFTRRLPLVLVLGFSAGPYRPGRPVLALRHPAGAWGSLEAALGLHSGGIEARHVVWMWRRVLESLAFAHDSGWAHGRVTLDRLVVHRDHLVHLAGWGKAERLEASDGGDSLRRPTAHRDLVQSAWAMRALLAGDAQTPPAAKAPAPLAELLERVTDDPDARLLDARTLSEQVAVAARQAFGPPRFVHFQLPDS